MLKVIILAVLLSLLPNSVLAQDAPLQYGSRIPGRIDGWYAPVGSNLIGSDEADHIRRGSVGAWDWSATKGSPVFAVGPGTVTYAGCNNLGGYGCWVQVDHGESYLSGSAHCLEGSIRVQSGQPVDASTQICNVGKTGITSWPHVHLVITKDGTHQPISNFFDPKLVRYCFWTKCQATNDPAAPLTFGSSSWRGVVRTFDGRVAGSVFLVFYLLFLMGNTWIRYGLYAVLTVYAAIVTAMPSQPTLDATPMLGSGSAGWEQVYPILQRNEGWSCTMDPVRTMGGVTQTTYDAWRMGQGLGYAHVCTSLTRAQAKQIYYQRYWVASGADRLPLPLALTHVDMAVNAGVGVAREILAQCGNNVACYNMGRIAAYKSMKNCPTYCRAWINRVNKIRKYSGG